MAWDRNQCCCLESLLRRQPNAQHGHGAGTHLRARFLRRLTRREAGVNRKQPLYSMYRRIRANCCDEWRLDPDSFYVWYHTQAQQQSRLCEYCNLPGDTEILYRKTFRRGRRGLRLEVDRRDNDGLYSPCNCVLACYPCNNAKSDVFSYEEFKKIGRVIHELKQT